MNTHSESPQQGQATVSHILDHVPTSKFHRKAVLVSGVGFFTDAYDLFVIATVATLVKTEWHLSTTQVSWVTGSAILGAFVGALIFGRLADILGRKSVYGIVAGLMIVGALASAFAPNVTVLVLTRFLLGLGIGGDYPVSAVLMSEYANKNDRGRLVGLVFSMQAAGLIVGPLVAIALLGGGVSHATTWRLLLGLGALPAAGVIYLRARMPESPRYQAQVHGDHEKALAQLAQYSEGVVTVTETTSETTSRVGALTLLTNPTLRKMVIGTAGAWFLFDYAYYGNTLSLPAILADVSPHATTIGKLAMTLGIFVVFALPGYIVSIWRMDRFGHRRLQLLGFAIMALCFALLAAVPALTAHVGPFLAIFGVSYFFVEFGPNTTTFVLPAEVFPTRLRTTGHGIAAGIGKLGAFIGVFVVPQLQLHIGLRGMLAVAAVASVLGLAVTLLLPEAGRRSLDEINNDGSVDGAIALPLEQAV